MADRHVEFRIIASKNDNHKLTHTAFKCVYVDIWTWLRTYYKPTFLNKKILLLWKDDLLAVG